VVTNTFPDAALGAPRQDLTSLLSRFTWLDPWGPAPVQTSHIQLRLTGRNGPAQLDEIDHVKQVHGTTIVKACKDTEAHSEHRLAADGIWTDQKNRWIGVKTADCLPVLLAGRTAVAAIHAGWRGLTSGILGIGVAKMLQVDGSPHQTPLRAWIGPAISQARYEVGPEVVTALFGPDSGLDAVSASLCLARGPGIRWLVDLQLAAALVLIRSGVAPEQISIVRACTTEELWFSYRRDGRVVGSNVFSIRLV
jgi:YfiH family protein